MSSKPKNKFRCGSVTATIWENEQQKEGKKFIINSITIERNYQDKDKNWKRTSSFGLNDLHKVEIVARRAFESLTVKEGVSEKRIEEEQVSE